MKGSDPNSIHEIQEMEMQDDFHKDAMEGWESVDYNISTMSALDKKFLPRQFGYLKTIGVFTGVVVITALTTLYFNTSQETEPIKTELAENNTELTIEETDIVLPEIIEEMDYAPKESQVSPKKMQEEFKEIQIIHEEFPIPIIELPLIDLKEEKDPESNTIQQQYGYAKEIYLHDFKLVDYTHYREAPKVHTKQMVLTGLPANKENELSEDYVPEWKNVDIPYTEYIDKSMRIFNRANYKKALTRFETILATYKYDVNANFYAGLCLFNLKEYNLAIGHFDNCLVGPYSNFNEEAIWMKALCLENTGESMKAKQLFKEIVDSDSFYKKQALEKLK